MATPKKRTPARRAAPRNPAQPSAKADAGQAQVQKAVDVEESKGFAGDEVDQTPNAHYTVAGVTAGKPTPETEKEG